MEGTNGKPKGHHVSLPKGQVMVHIKNFMEASGFNPTTS